MNDEERQRMMDFILQQQANADARLGRLIERGEQANARMTQFDARMDRLAEHDEQANVRITRLERVLKLAIKAGLRERREWRERHAALVDAQIRTDDSVRRTEDNVRELSAATQRNSESIDRLTKILERNATGQNGGDAR